LPKEEKSESSQLKENLSVSRTFSLNYKEKGQIYCSHRVLKNY